MRVLETEALAVDRRDDIPVGVQLAWKLRAAIASGRLLEADRLPSVRELAELSGVNVNTARAVYARLEREGLIETRHGLGTFVADQTGASPDVERIAAETVAKARQSGLSPRDVARAIYSGDWAADAPAPAPDPTPDFGPDADEAAARRELRRQIARLEAELAFHPEARPEGGPGRPAPRRKGGYVAGLAELEATRDELMTRLKKARAEADRRGRREGRARLRREDMAARPERHRFERLSMEECGDPGCGEFRVVPRFGPVGALAGWWRLKVSSGCPLAVSP
jgi:DNA-binding transcriptional regulator YhcF (GntR family)